MKLNESVAIPQQRQTVLRCCISRGVVSICRFHHDATVLLLDFAC